MGLYGIDKVRYGSSLLSHVVHPISYYNKSWKLSSLSDASKDTLLSSLSTLSSAIYDMYIGNIDQGDEKTEETAINFAKIINGDIISPIQRIIESDDDKGVKVHISGIDDTALPISLGQYIETGSYSSLKSLFPFFDYWKQKAEAFVNAEKQVTINMNISKFFDDINVDMKNSSDTAELERDFVSMLNRSLEIALSTTEDKY